MLKKEIINEVNEISNLELLNQLFCYLQIIKKTDQKLISNKDKILKFSGSISDEEAKEMKEIINKEFNQIEGSW